MKYIACLLIFGAIDACAQSRNCDPVYRLIADDCKHLRGGRASGTAFGVRAGEKGIPEPYFITALHVVNGCGDLRIVVEDSDTNRPPVSTVRLILSRVDIENDLAALTFFKPSPAVLAYFRKIELFRLAPAPRTDVQEVEIAYYSENNPDACDIRRTTVTTGPPLRLRQITQNTNFPWPELDAAKLPFLDTEVIRLGGVAWSGFSGAPLISLSTATPAAIGVVDGGVHDRLQWAVAAWHIKWQNEPDGRVELLTLLSLSSKVRLFASMPTREVVKNGKVIPFLAISARLLNDQARLSDNPTAEELSKFFVFVQESELSNAQASALVRDGKKNGDEFPYLTKSPQKAAEACDAMGADLLSGREYASLLRNILREDGTCFANLGNTARSRGCPSEPPVDSHGMELDNTASVKYVEADRFPTRLGLRNILGNSWEWTKEGKLAGGAVDTVISGRDVDQHLRQLTRNSGEGTVRCVLR